MVPYGKSVDVGFRGQENDRARGGSGERKEGIITHTGVGMRGQSRDG